MIKELLKVFSFTSFVHVYREENQEVEILSKNALTSRSGSIAYNQWEDGQEGPELFASLSSGYSLCDDLNEGCFVYFACTKDKNFSL